MTIETRYKFRGLNKRSSDINMAPEFASDLQNVELSSKRELLKRYGFDSEITSAGIIDVIESVSQQKLLFIKADGIYEILVGVMTKIPFSGDGSTFTGLVDYDEYEDVVYVTDTTLNRNLYKYDGIRVYRAGLPKVNVISVTNSGAGAALNLFYRVYFAYRDNQNNFIFGDYFQTDQIATANQPIFNIDTLLGTEFPHDNVAGDLIPVGVMIAGSANRTFGYNFFAITADGSAAILTVDHTGATDAVNVNTQGATYSATNEPFEDAYDPTQIKALPPLAKYVAVYGATMVLGNIKNNGAIGDDTENTVMWSDTGVGSTVETYPPFNKEVVGKTSEGVVSGLFASVQELIILKEKQVYYVNGILVGRGFRLRSALTAGIGCVSHKSIIETESGCLFQSVKGIHFAGGSSSVLEISDIIETIFTEDTTGLDFTKCRATRDTVNEKLLFFIPATLEADNIVLVYDYYHKEWFLHKGFVADEGLIIHQDDLYHCDGTDLFKRNATYNDDGVAIDAFWFSAWEDLGIPSIRKKFVNMIVLSIGAVTWVCNVISQVNWIKTANSTDETIDFSPAISNDDQKLNMEQVKSMRFGIKNNVLNEGMLVTGYEFEWESTQKKPKGEG